MNSLPKIIVASLLLLALASPARSQLLENGGFEQPLAPVGDRTWTSHLPGWTVHGNVDVIHAGFWDAAEGVQSLDLSGEDSGPGTYIEQAVPTVPGQEYVLAFSYANNPDAPWASGRVDVLGATTLLSRDLFHRNSTKRNMGYSRFRETFVADSSSTALRFTHLDSPTPLGRGLALDAVAVTPAALLSIRVSQVEICWDTATNAWYQLQYRSALWTNQGVPLTTDWVQGDGTRFCVNDAVFPGQDKRFYRVAVTNSSPAP